MYSDRIEVFFNFKFEKIISVAVTPDESMVLEHMDAGASVGLDRVVIFIAKDGELTNPRDIKSNDKNIWIYLKGRMKK